MSALPIVAEIAEGVHFDLPFDQYRAIERLSYSGAKKIITQSLAHYLVERNTPRASSVEQQFGTAFHTLLLEPELFDAQTIAAPRDAPKRPSRAQLDAAKPSAATLEAIAFWREFDAQSTGRIVLDASDMQRLQAMVAAVQAHPGAMRLLADGRPEVSALWTDGRFGVPCKLRMDWQRSDGGIVDLKTAADASPGGFARAAANFQYHVQAAAYFSGCEHAIGRTPPFWSWLVVEKEPPFGVATYVCQPDALMAGMALWDRALALYAEALATGEWPAYPPTIEPLIFPQWALRVRM